MAVIVMTVFSNSDSYFLTIPQHKSQIYDDIYDTLTGKITNARQFHIQILNSEIDFLHTQDEDLEIARTLDTNTPPLFDQVAL